MTIVFVTSKPSEITASREKESKEVSNSTEPVPVATAALGMGWEWVRMGWDLG